MAAADDDLLFGLTALELRFVTRDQLTHASASGGGESLRARLLRAGVLTERQAAAIDAVLAERRSEAAGRDPMDTVPAGEYAPGDTPQAPSRPASVDPFLTRVSEVIPAYGAQRFSVLRLHQQGGLGRVSVARDMEFNREIALKEIRPERADDLDNRRRFLREAEITGALEHPGVVPVYSLGQQSDGRPYYAMRFVRGVDLQQAITDFHHATPERERPLRFRRLLARLVTVCQTLDYAHSRGVLHRDVKPSNIMLGDYGETLVVDWGLAKVAGEPASSEDLSAPPLSLSGKDLPDKTQAGKVVGTPLYMSPEQAEGRIDLLTAATDIYGLGATLYQLMTGVPPFQGDDLGVLADVRHGRFPPPSRIRPDMPKPLEAICLRAMARKPADRYRTAGELAEDLEKFLADEPVGAYREPPLARMSRWARNHRTLVRSIASAGAVALIMLTGSVALLTAANRRERQATQAATQAAIEAEQQRNRAEQNFALARQAVQDYYVSVSEETLLQQPGMQPLRDTLLRQALGYYQRFLQERGDDPQLLREVAMARFYTGRITETIGSVADALPHYDQAEAMQRQLIAAGDGSQSLRTQLAATLNARGRALFNVGELEASAEAYQQAIDLRAALAEEAPTDAERARELANSIMNLALVEARSGAAEAALPSLERAQALRLAHADSASDAIERDLAQGAYNLAAVRLMLGDIAQAEDDFHAAIEQFARLAESNPGDLRNRHRLGMTQRLLATTLNNAGDRSAAADGYRQAAETLQRLSDQNPTVTAYAADLAAVRMDLAELLAATEGPASGAEQIAQAVATLRKAQEQTGLTPRVRSDLAVALRFWGELLAEQRDFDGARQRLEEARTEWRALVREAPREETYLDELTHTQRLLESLDKQESDGDTDPEV